MDASLIADDGTGSLQAASLEFAADLQFSMDSRVSTAAAISGPSGGPAPRLTAAGASPASATAVRSGAHRCVLPHLSKERALFGQAP